MPRICKICSHKHRQTIEEGLLSGEAYRSIAKRFSISAPALFRHKAQHLLESVQRSHEASEVLRGDALVDHVARLRERTEDLYAEAESILSQAKRAKDLKTALDGIRTASGVIRETRSNAELLGRLTGMLSNVPTQAQIMIVLPDLPSPEEPTEYSAIDITPTRRW
jgi:transposase-like protein